MHISAVPFPTVTICPITKASLTKLDVFRAYHMLKTEKPNLTDIELSRMEALLHICHIQDADFGYYQSKYANESIYELIKDTAPALNDTFFYCEWQHELIPCASVFAPVLTDDGLCFSFNALNSQEIYTEEMAPELMIVKNNPNVSQWSLENGYDDTVNKKSYPFRIFNAKRGGALVTYLRSYERDLEYLCHGTSQGFKVILHTPGEVGKMSRNVFRLPRSREAIISIKPTVMITSDGLRLYTPNQRNCFFNTERHLRFFKLYTQRERYGQICGATKVKCYTEAEKALFDEDTIDGLTDENAKSFRKDCYCLPACTSITYDAEIDRVKIDLMQKYKAYNFSLDSLSGVEPSDVSISFKDYSITSIQKSDRYQWSDFLSVCGGLLGLFLGVSAFSIIEFIYFSTVRLFCTVWTSNSVTSSDRNAIKIISVGQNRGWKSVATQYDSNSQNICNNCARIKKNHPNFKNYSSYPQDIFFFTK
ncbi:pickpocket protein 28-like [Sitodiplosis mosellana]|uniref:pickpocket protein 28-like n=1 Tax=Sitodiplosis mosellana TaxID=263140 RepID=UPI002443A321|nr:pickpocket protein 28-like [Sitodiplosis mosellana]